jgi:hypothetical protein
VDAAESRAELGEVAERGAVDGEDAGAVGARDDGAGVDAAGGRSSSRTATAARSWRSR